MTPKKAPKRMARRKKPQPVTIATAILGVAEAGMAAYKLVRPLLKKRKKQKAAKKAATTKEVNA